MKIHYEQSDCNIQIQKHINEAEKEAVSKVFLSNFLKFILFKNYKTLRLHYFYLKQLTKIHSIYRKCT